MGRGCGPRSSPSRWSTALILHLLPPIGTGVDLIPAILLATFGNLLLIGAVAPWLARRTWKRRPAAEPGAPPRAQLEVLTDRIGTGLLLATIVGVMAAGLAARPLVVSETEDTERERQEALRATSWSSGDRRAGPQPRDRQHGPAGRGLLPHLHRRATTASTTSATFVDTSRIRPTWTSTAAPSRNRRSRSARAARCATSVPPAGTSNSSSRFAPGRRAVSGTRNEKYSALASAKSKLRPTSRGCGR